MIIQFYFVFFFDLVFYFGGNFCVFVVFYKMLDFFLFIVRDVIRIYICIQRFNKVVKDSYLCVRVCVFFFDYIVSFFSIVFVYFVQYQLFVLLIAKLFSDFRLAFRELQWKWCCCFQVLDCVWKQVCYFVILFLFYLLWDQRI